MSIPFLAPLWEKIVKAWNRDDDLSKLAKMRELRTMTEIRLDQVYVDLASLEEREAEYLTEGRRATSTSVKRRLASQISHIRKDITRVNTLANMLNGKIAILTTDISNVAIVNEGKAIGVMPDSEALAENAVAAEQALEDVSQGVELANSLTTSQSDILVQSDEEAIMAEFEVPEIVGELVEEVEENTTVEVSPVVEDTSEKQGKYGFEPCPPMTVSADEA